MICSLEETYLKPKTTTAFFLSRCCKMKCLRGPGGYLRHKPARGSGLGLQGVTAALPNVGPGLWIFLIFQEKLEIWIFMGKLPNLKKLAGIVNFKKPKIPRVRQNPPKGWIQTPGDASFQYLVSLWGFRDGRWFDLSLCIKTHFILDQMWGVLALQAGSGLWGHNGRNDVRNCSTRMDHQRLHSAKCK